MDLLLALPLLLPLGTAALSLVVSRWGAWRDLIAVSGASLLALAATTLFVIVWNDGIQTVQVGGWPAPFGITLIADTLSATMVLLAAFMGLSVVVYSVRSVNEEHKAFGYYPMINVLLLGICGSFLTGDLFNLYVWFEVMLVASFVLISLGGERNQIEGALKYVVLNLFSSTMFLIATGILYGTAGTLNMADLAVALEDPGSPGLVTTVAMLFMVAFGIKAAVFPLYFWLPSSYHTPPAVVSAIFAGLLTKVGVYALIRVFTLLFVNDTGYTHDILLVVAGLTMLSGGLGAIAQSEFRRVLSFQIVSSVGYMLMGLGLLTPLALAGSIFYIIQDVLVKTNLFLVSGVTTRLTGSDNIASLGGMYRRAPLLGLMFAVPVLSLAGIPPLPGFLAKVALLQAGLGAEQYAIVGAALAGSLLTIIAMMQLWSGWWRPPVEALTGATNGGSRTGISLSTPAGWSMIGPILFLTAATVCLALAADPVFSVAERAASQVLDRSGYIEAVLGATE